MKSTDLVRAYKLRNRKHALAVIGAVLILVPAVWLGIGYWEQLERDQAATTRISHGVVVTVCYFDDPFSIEKRIFCGFAHLAGWSCLIRSMTLQRLPD